MGLTSIAIPGRGEITTRQRSRNTPMQTASRSLTTTASSTLIPSSDSQLLIVDDAHTAENYIAQLWTFRVERFNKEQEALFTALAGTLKGVLDPYLYARLTGEWTSLADKLWVDKLPTPDLLEIARDLREVIDEHTGELDLKHPWRMIGDHLEACQLYVSSTEILIRPLIPPTWSHAPFAGAKQRIFMSATLGAGGGGSSSVSLDGGRFKRLAIPEGWDKQGIGRRFFHFPDMSLRGDEVMKLRRRLMRKAERSLVLVPSNEARNSIKKDVDAELKFKTFSADDIEATNTPFTHTKQAVAIVANRYDGIDFPGDDCRLLFIEGLPRATNLQERFLMARMGANLLFNERVQTRVLQAVGRCTRGLNDFSAVVVTGDELPEYLADRNRRAYLHPELQAELEFGTEQSKEIDADTLIENLGIFLDHGKDWEDVNQEILGKARCSTETRLPSDART